MRPEASVTENGVTITVKQTLTDVRGIYALYEVTLPEGIAADYAAWRMSSLLVETSVLPEGSGFGFIGGETLDSSGNKLTMLLHIKQQDDYGDGQAVMDLCDLNLYANGELLTTITGIWHLEWEFTYNDSSSIEIPVARRFALGESSVYAERIVLAPTSVCIFGEGDITLYYNKIGQESRTASRAFFPSRA